MAHLKQKQISDNSCKAIIIDTLLEAVRPLTQEELSREITSLFHILVSAERLKQEIHALSLEGVILLDEDDYLRISPSKQPDFIIARLKETTLRKEATIIWLGNLRTQQELSSELEKVLSRALPIFLRSLFVKHGVLSYELLTSTSGQSTFDLQDIAHHVSLEFDETYRAEIETLLPSIFQISNHETVIEYSIVGCFLYLWYNIPRKFCQVFCPNSVYSGAFAGILFSLFSAVQILTVLCRTENRKAKPRNRLGLVSANSIL